MQSSEETKAGIWPYSIASFYCNPAAALRARTRRVGMTSERQIVANRANAQASTGPKTDAGKARSSRNALKHGATAKYLLPGESAQEFGQFSGGPPRRTRAA